MHLVIGTLLAGVASLLQPSGDLAGIPARRTGPVRAVHVLPGRIRFRIPALKQNGRGRDTLCQQLPRLPGVRQIEVNTTTGSLLLLFDGKTVQPGLLFAATVRLLGLERELELTPTPILVQELRHLGAAVNRAVFEKTGGFVDLWTSFLILLAVAGTRKLAAQGSLALPAGFTLIWWSINGLRHRQGESS